MTTRAPRSPRIRLRTEHSSLAGVAREFVEIYRQSVLAQRTRNYRLPKLRRTPEPEILHTLLGIELRLGRKRMLCPDLATARYLAVFSRIGLADVAIPYDITRVSTAADALETALERALLRVEHLHRTSREETVNRWKRRMLNELSTELQLLGTKPNFPEFTPPARYRRR